MFRAGTPPEEIARQREIKTTTVFSHLVRCIEEGELTLSEVIPLTDRERRAIELAFLELIPPHSPLTLKPAKLGAGRDGTARGHRGTLDR